LAGSAVLPPVDGANRSAAIFTAIITLALSLFTTTLPTLGAVGGTRWAQTRTTKSTDETTLINHATLPAERAFVVQLRTDADLASGIVRGRVEHVVSGVAASVRIGDRPHWVHAPRAEGPTPINALTKGENEQCPLDDGLVSSESQRAW